MARDLTNKCKLCRRAGEKLFLKGDRCNTPKCAFVRRSYPPGVHGLKGKRARSEFGEQLVMKQKLKRIYSVMEKQLKKYFNEIRNKPGVTSDLLMQKLEMRLDNIIYRANFSKSRAQARQLVRHSFFMVNGKKVNIPSYEVKIGEIIEIKSSKANREYIKQLIQAMGVENKTNVPSWLEVDSKNLSIKVKSKPSRDDISFSVNAQMIIEFYSR